jgi:L-alanine-DL-glutamate epimerase-like enolase superfamily enzyme
MGALGIRAVSAIDIALWDLLGKQLDASVSRLLGRPAAGRYPAVATAVFYPPQKSALETRLHRSLALEAEGYRGIKLKVGGLSPAEDIEHVRSIREALRTTTMLAVDANSGYFAPTAFEVGLALREVGIYWFEEPVPVANVEAYADLARAGLRLAGGQDSPDAGAFIPLLERRALQILQPSVAAVGGITGALQVGAVADAFGAQIVPTGWGTGVLIAASTHVRHATSGAVALPFPDENWIEVDVTENPLREGVTVSPPVYGGGYADVPRGPGLGVEIAQPRVDEWTVGRIERAM